jgi:hypothetical protein
MNIVNICKGQHMTDISFIITTSGKNEDNLNQIIDSIEIQNIPEYQIIIIGGLETKINRNNTIHIPFDETVTPKAWLTRKKNTGVLASKYGILVIMHDYMTFDKNWYSEFERFGIDWDICVHQNLAFDPSNGTDYVRANGWRVESMPQYPEFPWAMQIPYDIDQLIPYMGINGSYWCCKKSVMLDEMLDESKLAGDGDDLEWSYRVVPYFNGVPNNSTNKIVSNPNCITRNIKMKPPHPGNPNWEEIVKSFEPIWNDLRIGKRRPGGYYYEKDLGKVVQAK